MRRVHVLRRPSKAACSRTVTLSIVFCATLIALAWYSYALSSLLFKTTPSSRDAPVITGSTSGQLQQVVPTGERITCVSWRQTAFCSPLGARDPVNDKPCVARIVKDSGFCECSSGLTTRRMECGRHAPFTCAAECGKLNNDMRDAVKLPTNVSCPAQPGPAPPKWHFAPGQVRMVTGGSGSSDLDGQAAALWRALRDALSAAGEDVVQLPEQRTDAIDWVRDGVHMPWEDILAARAQWHKYMEEAPGYPEGMFAGKGIVILGGGLTYMVPAWVNVHMLRRTGCQLPVEMWFPAVEFPTPPLIAALAQLGVITRKLPEIGKPAGRAGQRRLGGRRSPPAGTQDMTGFTLKIAALILSQFQEVLFLDSDNVAVADPTALFESEEYRGTGALLWPDYWKSSAAPDLRHILQLPSLPSPTFESGQMLFDKQRTWKGLILAAFFNMQAGLYYELFSCFMGKGDKESFAHALSAVGLPYHLIGTPVGSVGLAMQRCSRTQRSCWYDYAGNSMTQHDPAGRLMFIHTNLSPKWNLQIPGEFELYTRRWQIVQPGDLPFRKLEASLGSLDLEQEIYKALVSLRCAPFLPSYVQALSRPDRMGSERTLPLDLAPGSFHPYNLGVNFNHAYRWGLEGPFLDFTPLTSRDRFLHFINGHVRPMLGYIGRVITFMRINSPQYFDLW